MPRCNRTAKNSARERLKPPPMGGGFAGEKVMPAWLPQGLVTVIDDRYGLYRAF